MHPSELARSAKYYLSDDGGGVRFSGGQSSPSFKSLQDNDEESPFFRSNKIRENAKDPYEEITQQTQQHGKISIDLVKKQDQVYLMKNDGSEINQNGQNVSSFAEQSEDCIQQIARVCFIHNQEMLSAFCIPCQKLICCECHSLHIGHKIELIDSANVHCKEIMREELKKINTMIEEYVKLGEELTSQRNELIEVYHQQQHEVDRCKRAILKFIEKQSKLILGQCQGLYDAKLECIAKEQKDLREALRELIQRHQSIESHLQADSPLSFCKYYSSNVTENIVKKVKLGSYLRNAFPMNKTIKIKETQGLKLLEDEFTSQINEILTINQTTSRQLSDLGKIQQQEQQQQQIDQKSQQFPVKSFFQCFKPTSNLSSIVTPLRNDPRKKISSGNSSKPSTLISHSAVSTAKSEYATADSRNRYEDPTGRQISKLVEEGDTARLAEVEMEDDKTQQYEVMRNQDNLTLQKSYSQSSFLDRKNKRKEEGEDEEKEEGKGEEVEEHAQSDLLSGQNLEQIHVEYSKFLMASNTSRNRLQNFQKNLGGSSQAWKQQEILKEQLEQQAFSRDHEELSVLSSSSFKVDQQQSPQRTIIYQSQGIKSFSQSSSPIRYDQTLFFKQNNKDLSSFVSSPSDNSSFQLPRVSLSPIQSKLRNSPNQLNSFLRQIHEAPALSQIEILRAHCSFSRSPQRMSPISSTQRRIPVTPKKPQKLTTVPIKKEQILRNENASQVECNQSMA